METILIVGIMLVIALIIVGILMFIGALILGEKVSRKEQLYIDCLNMTKKSLYEITDEDKKICQDFVKELKRSVS